MWQARLLPASKSALFLVPIGCGGLKDEQGNAVDIGMLNTDRNVGQWTRYWISPTLMRNQQPLLGHNRAPILLRGPVNQLIKFRCPDVPPASFQAER